MAKPGFPVRSCVASTCALGLALSSTAFGQAAAGASQQGALEKQVEDVREQLRKMQEQQSQLMQTLDQLEQQIANKPAAPAGQPPTPAPQNTAPPAASPAPANPEPAASGLDGVKERYNDGIIVWQTGPDAKVPFLLRFNVNTQVRYLNTESANDTFTDHLGVVRDVHSRNDITVNRSMFILAGYIFDPRLKYSSTVWTSAGSASIVVAGTIGWTFNDHLTLTGGYTGVPGSRSLVNTFPFFTSTDRSMADNFFRPGFTQGLYASGKITDDLNYLAFIGNGLNTLNISAAKIDSNLLGSGSIWWEPLGDYGPPGKSRHMYDDYYATSDLRIRLGTAYTRSREDRFNNLDTSSPENTSMYNSDGVLTFATGAFAPGVTVEEATYQLWALDWGLKWNGWAVNGQYFFRQISDFKADGAIPQKSTFDHGFEMSVAKFVVPQKVMVYGRGSMVFGEFRDSWEAAVGAKWYFVPTERMWLTAELMRTVNVPYSGTFTPYTAGMTAWVPMIQAILAF